MASGSVGGSGSFITSGQRGHLSTLGVVTSASSGLLDVSLAHWLSLTMPEMVAKGCGHVASFCSWLLQKPPTPSDLASPLRSGYDSPCAFLTEYHPLPTRLLAPPESYLHHR